MTTPSAEKASAGMPPCATPYLCGFRGALLDCYIPKDISTTNNEPEKSQESAAKSSVDLSDLRYFEDGLLIVERPSGKIQACGPYVDVFPKFEGKLSSVHEYPAPQYLITPGMIDTHIHYPQTEMVASYGAELLDWLTHSTFPTEIDFHQRQGHDLAVANYFLDVLLSNGTTTALVFATSAASTADTLFMAAEKRNLRLISGQVWMDRNAPEALLNDTRVISGTTAPEPTYVAETRALISKWHQRSRLLVAVTPRFAITSTSDQLAHAGALLREDASLYLHTHLSENRSEMAYVRELFPESSNYLDVYHRYGLVRARSVFAHGVHLDPEEVRLLCRSQAGLAHCPTSNLFLGSGLFPLHRYYSEQGDAGSHVRHAWADGLRIGLGTDIGAGTSFSVLQTAAEAYKVARLQGHAFTPAQAFYLATLGGARALHLEHCIGNFEVGKEADFVVLDLLSNPLLRLRLDHLQRRTNDSNNNQNATVQTHLASEGCPWTKNLMLDLWFAAMVLGDSVGGGRLPTEATSLVHATYILGERYSLNSTPQVWYQNNKNNKERCEGTVAS